MAASKNSDPQWVHQAHDAATLAKLAILCFNRDVRSPVWWNMLRGTNIQGQVWFKNPLDLMNNDPDVATHHFLKVIQTGEVGTFYIQEGSKHLSRKRLEGDFGSFVEKMKTYRFCIRNPEGPLSSIDEITEYGMDAHMRQEYEDKLKIFIEYAGENKGTNHMTEFVKEMYVMQMIGLSALKTLSDMINGTQQCTHKTNTSAQIEVQLDTSPFF